MRRLLVLYWWLSLRPVDMYCVLVVNAKKEAKNELQTN
jgi:hypothetical protein